MAGVNLRALYILSFVFALLCEVCYIPVLSIFVNNSRSKNVSFCWSWKLGDSKAGADGTCPFLVFVIASLFNSLLLLFTGIYFALRLCIVAEYFQDRLCLKIVLKYGHFVSSLMTTLLALVFIGLMIGYKYAANAKTYKEYFGGIVGDKHYYLILVCIGTFLSLLSSVVNGILCYRKSRGPSDQFSDASSGQFNIFTDYSNAIPTYEQIN